MAARARILRKEPVRKSIDVEGQTGLGKYSVFVVGSSSVWELLKYEAAVFGLAPFPGALGFWLRKVLYRHLFRTVGSAPILGRNISFRHPGKISLGNRVAVDDGCLLDARGAGPEGITIGDDVVIARDTIIQAKASPITIGDRCIIGSQCQLSSAGGIQLGRSVMIGGQSYLGGGRYRTASREVPMMDQELYSLGPVVIEDDVWIGAGVLVLDGVRIGTGSIIGAGAVVRESLPPFTVATPYQKLVLMPRDSAPPPRV